MTPTRTLTTIAALVALTATACGDSNSGQEAALERLIEAESGQDIDLDLDGDGGFSVQTEDGEFSIDIDGEGNVVFDTDEGSGTFDADGDTGGTFEFEGEDGSGSVQIDEDGSFVVTDDEGEVVTGDADSDGGFTVTGEDGEIITTDIDPDDGSVVVQSDDGATFESGSDIPSQWPDDVPRPEGLTDVTGTFMGDGASMNIFVAGTPTGDPSTYLQEYAAQLIAVGFTETAQFSDQSSLSLVHDRDGTTVSSSYTDLGDSGQVVVSISRV